MTASDRAAIRTKAWLEVSDLVDLQFSPLGLHAIAALMPEPSDVIVDIGCGTGQTLLQLAERVGPEGQIIGVDIEPSLLDRARERAAGLRQVRFIEGDAAQLHLPDESVDGVFSRFGVMNFADPVAAFSVFHRFMKPSARLTFVCWRSLEENELDILPLRAAELGKYADKTPFSFEKPAFTRNVLSTAGFKEIVIAPHDQKVSSGGLDDKVGALGKIVRENPELHAAAEQRLRVGLTAKLVAGRVSLNAAIWLVTAMA